MSKVILLDISVFTHRAINSWGAMTLKKRQGLIPYGSFIAPVGYTFFMMIISALKKIGVTKEDLIIGCMDGRDSWRKDVLADYKAQRKAAKEKQTHIDWTKMYAEIGLTINQLKDGTNFHWIQIPKIEADDVMAVATEFYPDKECVLVTIDGDLKQLCHRPNVKFFSLMKKYKGVNGTYVEVLNPLKIIADKVKKGDVSDNIIVDKKNDTEYDAQLREYIINLLKLPDFVTKTVINYLEDLKPNKPIQYDLLPYQKSLALKFDDIYKLEGIVDPQDAYDFENSSIERKKKKKAKEKVSFR